MTKLLDQAIARVRELPAEEQERAAEALMLFAQHAKQGVYSRPRSAPPSRNRGAIKPLAQRGADDWTSG